MKRRAWFLFMLAVAQQTANAQTNFNTFTWHPERTQWVLRMESQSANGERQLFATDTLSPTK